MRKRRNNLRNTEYTTGHPPAEQDGKLQMYGEQDGYSNDAKAIYEHHNAIQELPGNGPPQSPNSNRISELDSIRPVSELDSIETGSERWSAMHGGRVVSPMLPEVAEIGDGQPSPSLEDVASSSQEPPNLPANSKAASKGTDEGIMPALPASTSI
jgi:hypothetical protein